MRKMKDSGLEWIGSIPSNWKVQTIKYNFNILSGATPQTNIEEYWDGDVIWVTPADYKTTDKYVTKGKRNISKKGLISCSTSLIPTGSIIFSKRAPIGTVALNTQELCTNQGCLACLRKDNQINTDYFYYVISSATEIFELLGSGTTFKEISANAFSNVKLPFPPDEEQKQIANYLDSKREKTDSLTSDIQTQIDTLEQYKRSIITEAVTKGLNSNAKMKDSGIEYVGEIPAHWNMHPLYYYFGERKHKNSLGQEDNLLSLSYGDIIRKDINSNGGLLPESFNTYNIIEAGDIIIRPTDLQNDKRSLRTGLAKEHGIITSAYIALMPTKPVNVAYYHYLLHAFDVMKVFYNMGNGVRQGLNFSEFSRLIVFEPPIKEQNEIADYLNAKCSEINKVIADKNEQLATIDEYKKSLIYEYVTGKKEVPTA
jgi:type I restriction enzyme S subunit